MAEFTPDYEGSWRCKHHFHRFCPVEGCSANVGCARLLTVKSAIDNAIENGDAIGDMTDEELACDMLAYYSEVEGWDMTELTDLVTEARKTI